MCEPWPVLAPRDGYLKYYNLGQKNPGLIEKRRKVYADNIKKYVAPGEAGRHNKAEQPSSKKGK